MSANASVRVCARFRPVNKVEKAENAKVSIKIVADGEVHVHRIGQEPKKFFLDHMFPPNTEQANCYEYTGKPLVAEVLKGYNATMFAYGQTGSGKTHTMEGDIESERMMGMVPRMVNDVFDGIMDADENLEFVVQVSFVEIYLERIKDLLEAGNENLKIREHKAQGIYIEGVSQPYVGSPEEIFGLMEVASCARAVSATRMNDVSSRSHSVFVFRLIATHKVTQSKKMSKLMMVDLAGSEKTRKTQATGQRLEEAKEINKSLSALGNVINALTTQKKHVPYRDSKLTRLLSDSLGGNSKTCIIVTCSPCDYNVEETISTLRFGTNCKKVKNKPKVNQELSISEYKMQIKKMQNREAQLLKTISILRSQVRALKKALVDAGGDVEAALAEAQQELEKAEAEMEEKQQQAEETTADVGSSRPRRRSDSDDGRARRSRARPVLAALGADASVEALKERIDELEELYHQEIEDKERYMDDVADIRNELDLAQSRVAELEQDNNKFEDKKKEAEESVKKMAGQIGEYRLYKTKLEFVEKENAIQMEKKRQEVGKLTHMLKQAREKFHESELSSAGGGGGPANLPPLTDKEKETLKEFSPTDMDIPKQLSKEDKSWKDQLNKRYDSLYQKLMKEMQRSRELRATGANADLLDLGSGDPGRKARLAQFITEHRKQERQIKEMKEEQERLKKHIRMQEQREKYNDALRRNWQNQLSQMEQAVLLANQIHNRDRIRFTSELAERDSELSRLKMFLAKITRTRGKTSRRTGRANNVMVPIKRKTVEKGASKGGPKSVVRKKKT